MSLTLIVVLKGTITTNFDAFDEKRDLILFLLKLYSYKHIYTLKHWSFYPKNQQQTSPMSLTLIVVLKGSQTLTLMAPGGGPYLTLTQIATIDSTVWSSAHLLIHWERIDIQFHCDRFTLFFFATKRATLKALFWCHNILLKMFYSFFTLSINQVVCCRSDNYIIIVLALL